MDTYIIKKNIRDSLYGMIYLATKYDDDKLVVIKKSNKQLVNKHVTKDGKNISENIRNEITVFDLLKDSYVNFIKNTNNTINTTNISLNYFPNTIHHPSILQKYEHFETKSDIYMILEHMDCDLHDFFISQNNKLCECSIRNIFKQICDGVLYMHKIGIAHMDLSLENILISKNNNDNFNVKICDFGLSLIHRSFPFTLSDRIEKFVLPKYDFKHIGKLSYCSPEFYSDYKFDAFKKDIYSLGIILYKMHVSSTPYEKPSENDENFVSFKEYLKIRKNNFDISILDDSERYIHNRCKHIPTMIIDLIYYLTLYENRRYNITDIYNHKWIKATSCKNHLL